MIMLDKRVFPNNRAEHVLRKTTLFGVYRRGSDGQPVPPAIMPDDLHYEGLINPYYPDVLNDLQLTDHYPVLQKIRLEGVETSVLSLNCMKQCQYIPAFRGYNNAFEKVESPEEYSQRLDLLANLIIALIEDNRPITFSLQEAPNYTTPLGRRFYEKIKLKTGWEFVPDAQSNTKAELVTLFDPQQLEFRDDVQSSTKDLRLQSITFRNKHTKQGEFQHINMHGKLPESLRYASFIVERIRDDSPPTIITGDSNIPAGDDAIQALSRTSTQHELDNHRNALRLLNDAGAHGSYTVVQGTIRGSKGGVDTLDILTTSPSLRTDSDYHSKRLPKLNRYAIEQKRLQNEENTRAIRPHLQHTITRLGEVFIHDLNYTIPRAYPTLSAGYPDIQVDLLSSNDALRIISFASRDETQAFSNMISRELNIKNKKPQIFGDSGRYSIILSTEQLDNIEFKVRENAPQNIGMSVQYKGRLASEKVEHEFLRKNPNARIELKRISGHDELRIVSFGSRNETQSFSDRISADFDIKNKKPQSFESSGRYSIVLSIEQLKRINNDTPKNQVRVGLN